MKELAEFPSFDLGIEGVKVKISSWDGEISPLSTMQEVWVTIRGIPHQVVCLEGSWTGGLHLWGAYGC